MFTTFVDFVGTEESWKMLTEAEKDWACWVKFGLPTSVTPTSHKKLTHLSESDLSLLDIQLARKGTPSVAKLWSTLYGYKGLMKTIFKPINLWPILQFMETLSDDDAEDCLQSGTFPDHRCRSQDSGCGRTL